MLRDFALNHGYTRDARLGAAVFGSGGQGAEFINWSGHGWHADGSRRRRASKKQKQAGSKQQWERRQSGM
ncbi:hypothetical protein PPUJ21368_21140 [Pseudomonas putida]|nr:hypothetical protein PPUJ21368_21140 [Pseudomonas putida]